MKLGIHPRYQVEFTLGIKKELVEGRRRCWLRATVNEDYKAAVKLLSVGNSFVYTIMFIQVDFEELTYFIKQGETAVSIDIWKYVHLFLNVTCQVTYHWQN